MFRLIPVNKYIIFFKDDRRKRLDEIRQFILNTDDRIEERIAWGLPTYYFKDAYLVQIRMNKNDLAFYSSLKAKSEYKEDLLEYKQNQKNTIYFPLDEAIPKELIENMVRFRIKEISE